jgi:hypothetical protein
VTVGELPIPSDREIERQVLGSLLWTRRVVDDISPEMFWHFRCIAEYLIPAVRLLRDRGVRSSALLFRVDGTLVPMEVAMGHDCAVVRVIPRLRQALTAVGAPQPDAIATCFEQFSQAAFSRTDDVLRLQALAQRRELMRRCSELYEAAAVDLDGVELGDLVGTVAGAIGALA